MDAGSRATNLTKCAECGAVLFEGEGEAPPEIAGPAEARDPCPECGSKGRAFEVGVEDMIAVSDLVASARVTRGLTDARIAVLFVLIGIASTVGTTAGFAEHSVLIGLAWAAAAVVLGIALLTLVYRWPWLRHQTMEGMHRITGR